MVGAPGVGKSTMVRWLLEPFTRLPAVKSKSLPLVRWEPLARNGQLVGGHLGYTRGAFSGTDALGMAVNPQACRWMLESKTAGQLDFIVGEGARLANSAFFTAARARADRVLLVQLRAREETLDARCAGLEAERELAAGGSDPGRQRAGCGGRVGARSCDLGRGQPHPAVARG